MTQYFDRSKSDIFETLPGDCNISSMLVITGWLKMQDLETHDMRTALYCQLCKSSKKFMSLPNIIKQTTYLFTLKSRRKPIISNILIHHINYKIMQTQATLVNYLVNILKVISI